MARGRFISNRIIVDRQINDLSTDTCRLAFTWLITLADCEGRVFGEPDLLVSSLFPRRVDITPEMMESFIVEWANADFVTWYQASDGERYIQFRTFEKHQVGLRKNREAPSSYPDPKDCKILAGSKPTVYEENTDGTVPERPMMNNSDITFSVIRLLGDDYNLHDACLTAYNMKKEKNAKSSSSFAVMIDRFEQAGVTMSDYLEAIDQYDQDGRYPGNAPTTYEKWTLNMVNGRNKKYPQLKKTKPEDYKKWTSK